MVIPAGAALEIVDGGVVITYAGDITLEGLDGGPFRRLVSTAGTITLRGEHIFGEVIAEHGSIVVEGTLQAKQLLAERGDITVTGDLLADEVAAPGGSVSVKGEIEVRRIEARDELVVEGRVKAVSLCGGTVRLAADPCEVKGVEGTSCVHLGAASYAIEVVISPTVSSDGAATGRINVLECDNQPSQNNLKGKFRLAEYAQFTGVDPAGFLAERGVRALEALDASVDDVELGEPVEEVPSEGTGIIPDVVQEPQEGPSTPRRVVSTDRSTRVVAAPAAENTADLPDLEGDELTDELIEELQPEAIEQIVDEDSLIEIMDGEDSEVQVPPLVLTPAAHDQLVASVDEMARTYPDRIPQQLSCLRTLVDGKQYRVLQIELAELFNALVMKHMKARTSPHHQVYSSFKTIRAIVGDH